MFLEAHSTMNRRRRNNRPSKSLRNVFQGRRPNTIRMYASRLQSLAKRLGMDDIPRKGHDILSPWWLADPDHVLRVLQQDEFSTNTIKSYLTAVSAFLSHVLSIGRLEGDRSALGGYLPDKARRRETARRTSQQICTQQQQSMMPSRFHILGSVKRAQSQTHRWAN